MGGRGRARAGAGGRGRARAGVGGGCVELSEVVDLDLDVDGVTGGRFTAHANGPYGRS